ncbi:hypothetical protein VM1G_11880 [Cytospora mali]|uniref:Uncharacterized protein n=1 Tax=Cytospora mali TaxID=578113 RepID=A0A194WBL7_CYTMA|nr:hypothetical protein VM1G_11880 [Valsa mali]
MPSLNPPSSDQKSERDTQCQWSPTWQAANPYLDHLCTFVLFYYMDLRYCGTAAKLEERMGWNVDECPNIA